MAEVVSSRVETKSDPRSTVLIIDDDEDLRNSVGRLLRSVGLNAQLFASIPDFLKSEGPSTPACLVLDIRLPGKSGLDFQRELAAANIHIPIIFITGHGDIPMTVQAMKGGLLSFSPSRFESRICSMPYKSVSKGIAPGVRTRLRWATFVLVSKR
jgi:FixJ family two-component response regulator